MKLRESLWRLSLAFLSNLALLITLMLDNCAADLAEHGSGKFINEFCTGETFRPRCAGGKNDVIVTLSARYGRMNFGECLKMDPEFATLMDNPRFINCFADVKHIIDRLCSGRTECDVRINDQNFDSVKPCLPGLKMHLEASYICLQVVAESRQCSVGLAGEPQHIIDGGKSQRSPSKAVHCGDASQPWTVEALAGQRIAVSLLNLDFVGNGSQSTWCGSSSSYLVDRNVRRNVSFCNSPSSVERPPQRTDQTALTPVYVSSSNHLQIVTKHNVEHKFIIRVEAVGCSDLAPPSNDAWLKRVDDEITIGCYMSRQSWHLKCINGAWSGTVGVCSPIGNNEQSASDSDHSQSIHLSPSEKKDRMASDVAALIAVASTGIALCSLIICIGVYCLHRQRQPVKGNVKSVATACYGKNGDTCNETGRLNSDSHC